MKLEDKSTDTPISHAQDERACALAQDEIDEEIDRVAASILEQYRPAFLELAK